jgi:hypothetical protein
MIPVDLDAIDLPENHPFAVKKQLAPGERRGKFGRAHSDPA